MTTITKIKIKDNLKEGRVVEEKELFKTTYHGKELKLVRLAIQKNGKIEYEYIGSWNGKPLPTAGSTIYLPKELLKNPDMEFDPTDNPWVVETRVSISFPQGFTDDVIELHIAGTYLFESTALRLGSVEFPPLVELLEEFNANHELNFKRLVKEIIPDSTIENGIYTAPIDENKLRKFIERVLPEIIDKYEYLFKNRLVKRLWGTGPVTPRYYESDKKIKEILKEILQNPIAKDLVEDFKKKHNKNNLKERMKWWEIKEEDLDIYLLADLLVRIFSFYRTEFTTTALPGRRIKEIHPNMRRIDFDEILIYCGEDVARQIFYQLIDDPAVRLAFKIYEKIEEIGVDNLLKPLKESSLDKKTKKDWAETFLETVNELRYIYILKKFFDEMPKTEEELKEFIKKYVVKEERSIFGKKIKWSFYNGKYYGVRVRLFKLLVRWYLLIKARELYEKKYKDKGRWEDLMTALMVKVCLENNVRKVLGLPEPLTAKEKQEEKVYLAYALILAKFDSLAERKNSDKGPYGIVTPDGYGIKLTRSWSKQATNFDFFNCLALIPGSEDIVPLGNLVVDDKMKRYIVSPEEYVKIKLGE